MGLVFEELIRKFAELSNETAGEHITPREVIRLMVNLIFVEDDEALSEPGVVRTIYDPTAGTGGMLSVAGEYLVEHNPGARLTAPLRPDLRRRHRQDRRPRRCLIVCPSRKPALDPSRGVHRIRCADRAAIHLRDERRIGLGDEISHFRLRRNEG